MMKLIQSQYASKTKDQTSTLKNDTLNTIDIRVKKTADAFRLVKTESDAKKFFENFEVVTVNASDVMFCN